MPDAEVEAIQTQAVPGGSEQILVVEDNEDLLEVTSDNADHIWLSGALRPEWCGGHPDTREWPGN